MEKKKVAIVTYNRIGEGQYDNGRISGKSVDLYVAQNGHKSKWAANPDCGGKEEARSRTAKSVVRQVELTDMDHVYLYVGSDGGEEMIRATRELPAENITYVLCDCNWGHKRNMINSFGHGSSKVIECECGGRGTLAGIAAKLLES